MTHWIVPEKFRENDGLYYARGFAEAFDPSRLLRAKVVDHDRHHSYQQPGFWGYCFSPTRTLKGYRISVFSCGEDYHFPWCANFARVQPPNYRRGALSTHAGILNVKPVVKSLAEGLIWILGHELFH